MNITFDRNVYFAAAGQELFNWGTAWNHCRKYAALEPLRAELGLDTGSVIAEPVFSDYLSRDLRLPVDSPAWSLHAYPQGSVPGVTLGEVKPQN